MKLGTVALLSTLGMALTSMSVWALTPKDAAGPSAPGVQSGASPQPTRASEKSDASPTPVAEAIRRIRSKGNLPVRFGTRATPTRVRSTEPTALATRGSEADED